MDKKPNNEEQICKKCKKKFKDKDELERHNWKDHPSNKYETAWSQTDFSSYSGSSYYKDDPYY